MHVKIPSELIELIEVYRYNTKLKLIDVDDDGENNIYSTDNIPCDLCKENYGDEICTSSITSPCCFSPMCPMCCSRKENIEFNYLFIKNIIYIQYSEPEPILIRGDIPIQENGSIQYQYQYYEPYDDKILNKYKDVEPQYNNYGSQNFKEEYENKDICSLYECRECGYKCSVRIYMSS